MGKSKRTRDDKDRPEKRVKRSVFDAELEKLQVELCRLQAWVKHKGLRVVVVFEGRDAAGKGGVIKRITERVSPRVFRVVALPAPTDRERSQLYLQRYIQHMPAAGEVVLFDRSWYNRAGVERVMGFCSDDEYRRFLDLAPEFEHMLVEDGILLIKYFFDVSAEVQRERFLDRARDPRKHWKLSPMDLESRARWWAYTEAYARMIAATDTDYAPWVRVPADNKRAARLNCITHLLSQVPYKTLDFELPDLPKRLPRPETAPETVAFRQTVPEVF